MADEGPIRINLRLNLSGRGIASTPERISEMAEQAAKLGAKQRTPPTRAFSGVLANKGGKAKTREPTAKEKKKAALPKTGPKPGLSHPSQKQSMGRDDDPVVVKG